MRRTLLTVALLLGLPAVVMAGVSCPICTIGVYDSANTRQNFGFWPAGDFFKDIWVSIDFDPARGISGLKGIELSISGLPSGPFGASDQWFPGPAASIGSDIRTPADTTGTAEGGKNIAWDNCLEDARNLGQITMFSVAPVGSDRVIRVLHRFPPSSPEFPRLLFNQCDAPIYTQTAPTGGCYVLNPSVPDPCSPTGQIINGCEIHCLAPIAVTAKTWSRIKQLYR
jgi:hypothetical protein